MPGFIAYAGLRVIGKPAPGETVVVAAASGLVGSLVSQLAKIAGARATGIAASPEKCAYVKDDLRFDAAINHSDSDFSAKLTAACTDGIDVYFENVGGAIWQAVLPLLNNSRSCVRSGLEGATPGAAKSPRASTSYANPIRTSLTLPTASMFSSKHRTRRSPTM